MQIPSAPDFYVSTRYVLDDQASKGVRNLENATRGLDRQVSKSKTSFKDLKSMLMGGLGMASIYGSVRFMGKAKEVLVDYGENLHQAKISVAALITESMNLSNMRGPEAFIYSMGVAGEQVEELRKAAALGLGDFTDYMRAYQLMMIPVGKSGGSLNDVVEMARLMVPVAMSLGQDVQTAAMQTSQMFMGNARNVMQFLKLMDIDPKQTNALAKSQEGRGQLLDMMLTKMRAWAPAAEEFGKTLEAQIDTLKDNLSYIFMNLGEPLRQAMTRGVIEANEWIEKNQDRLDYFIESAGPKLATAFSKSFGFAIKGAEFLAKNGEVMVGFAKSYLRYMLMAKAATMTSALGKFSIGMGENGAMSLATAGAAESIQKHIGTPGRLGRIFNPLKTRVSKGAINLGNALSFASKGIMALSIGKLIIDIIEDVVLNEMNKGYKEDLARIARDGQDKLAPKMLEKMGLMPYTSEDIMPQSPMLMRDFKEKESGWHLSSINTRYKEYLRNFKDNEAKRRDREAGKLNAQTLADLMNLPSFNEYLGELSPTEQRMLRRNMKSWAESGEMSGMGTGGSAAIDRVFDEALGKMAKKELRGKVEVNSDFRNSKFEVVIDSGDYEPDTLAFELEDRFISQAAARVSSRFAPGLAGV